MKIYEIQLKPKHTLLLIFFLLLIIAFLLLTIFVDREKNITGKLELNKAYAEIEKDKKIIAEKEKEAEKMKFQIDETNKKALEALDAGAKILTVSNQNADSVIFYKNIYQKEIEKNKNLNLNNEKMKYLIDTLKNNIKEMEIKLAKGDLEITELRKQNQLYFNQLSELDTIKRIMQSININRKKMNAWVEDNKGIEVFFEFGIINLDFLQTTKYNGKNGIELYLKIIDPNTGENIEHLEKGKTKGRDSVSNIYSINNSKIFEEISFQNYQAKPFMEDKEYTFELYIKDVGRIIGMSLPLKKRKKSS